MLTNLSHVMTLANSIIGVSVLAMPYCFKQCGIILAILVLVFCSVLSRLACHFLVKSAVMSRRRNYELLAFHAFGHMGKFIVELFIIGFLLGTCIAFFVVVGDLGPQIVGKMLNRNPEDIRTSFLITTGLLIVLPLGLLRNIDSLSAVCTITIGFYLCLVFKIMAESTQHIFTADWYDHVQYWRPSGILQCLPIFSMALFCQTQLFEIYEAIPNVSLDKMNQVVRSALNICTVVYLCVGLFGYIAFCTEPFSGNILMSFPPSTSSEMIKIGFVLSVAFSFPLVIFPCRGSLNSFLFRRVYTHEPALNYMSETRFRCLTLFIVLVSLFTGIIIPNIEFVLGLVGSTIGVMICLIFPAAFFISISSKNTNERLLAQTIVFISVWIMLLGTYANLYALEESNNIKISLPTNKAFSQMNNLPFNIIKDEANIIPNVPVNPAILNNIKANLDSLSDRRVAKIPAEADIRPEPPIPVERIDITNKPSNDILQATFAPEIKEIVQKMKNMDDEMNKAKEPKENNVNLKSDEPTIVKPIENLKEQIPKDKNDDIQKSDNLINLDAIKKEENELAADKDTNAYLPDARNEELRKTLKEHHETQKKLMEEQKEIIEEIKEQNRISEIEKRKKAEDTEKGKNIENKNVLNDENLSIQHQISNDKSIILKVAKVDSQEKIKEFPSLDEKKIDKVVADNTKKGVKNIQEGEVKIHNVEEIIAETNKKEDIFNVNLNEDKNFDTKINDSDNLKGPILNALSRRTVDKSHTEQVVPKIDNDASGKLKIEISDNITKELNSLNNEGNEDKNTNNEYSIPIAYKLSNQTNGQSKPILFNKSDEVQAMRRDILENHDREKRDINVGMDNERSTDIEVSAHRTFESLAKNVSLNVDREKCTQSRKSENVPESNLHQQEKPIADSTSSTVIKTNAYLSEQEFNDHLPLEENDAIKSDFSKLNQRDLTIKVNENSEI